MVLHDDVRLSEQRGKLGRRNRLDSSAIDERFANCMDVLDDAQFVAMCGGARALVLCIHLYLHRGRNSEAPSTISKQSQTLTNRRKSAKDLRV